MSATLHMSDAAGRTREWTPEQRAAIERRAGDLLLAAGAGSGKTSVLVERFVRSVVHDGIAVANLLTITFTEKAAAEMRDRIRERLRELGEFEAAAATEGAFITTIHGFCARLLRAHALTAGIDPAFRVLDEHEARSLAFGAFGEAVEGLAGGREVVEILAAYRLEPLRAGLLAIYAELRSRGRPVALPAVPAPGELEPAVAGMRRAAAALVAELEGVDSPGARVIEALERLGRCDAVAGVPEPWPSDLDALALPRGNGAALSTPVCQEYSEALARLRGVGERRHAARIRDALDRLLRAFASRYEARKAGRSALDFEDLELLARRLLTSDAGLRARYRGRFARIMVDELQDTNAVQLELINAVADGNLFTVGDAQQSIYGFRHADVALFEALAERRRAAGAYATLQVNFRTRAEVLDVINAAFAGEPGGEGSAEDASAEVAWRFVPLVVGRHDAPAPDPRVELILVDKGADFQLEGQVSPWRIAEARVLAARVAALITEGTAARDIVVLTRATTDMRTYERALEQHGIPTYLIGGRGYWGHPQVIDLLAYLRSLDNPRDEEALYTVLRSPLVGVSLDALVHVAAASAAEGRDPWGWLETAAGSVPGVSADDDLALRRFVPWLSGQRRRLSGSGLEAMIDRAVADTGYDVAILACPDGRRRLANVRKLMRLAREYEAEYGPGLAGFLAAVAQRAAGGADARESEAPVEGEALDAVRLMTIHRAKGLEFHTVCVADLGRVRRPSIDLLRVGADGRLGLRLARAGSDRAIPALSYAQLGQEQLAVEEAEERRLYYVAMTRAQERLVISGAARLETWPEGNGGTAVGWVASALVPDIGQRLESGVSVSERGVRVTVDRNGGGAGLGGGDGPGGGEGPGGGAELGGGGGPGDGKGPGGGDGPGGGESPGVAAPTQAVDTGPRPVPALSTLSYTALTEYRRCGYRFWLQRVLGVPPLPSERGAMPAQDTSAAPHTSARPPTSAAPPPTSAAPPPTSAAPPPTSAAPPPTSAVPPPTSAAPGRTNLSASERGVLVHALLERLEFRRPVAPAPAAVARVAGELGLPDPTAGEARRAAELVAGFCAGELCARLGRATQVRREQRFSFPLTDTLLMTGALDVLARERTGMLVLDYKSDRLDTATPAAVCERDYAGQRLIYALAVLRTGAPRVEVAHVFLEAPDEPVIAAFTTADRAAVEAQLDGLAAGLVRGEFAVAAQPHRSLCDGCPAEGGLCSWPVAMTRRLSPDQLF